jgi:hypothetical protein
MVMQITSGTTPVIVFLMVSSTDDKTAVTGLTPAVTLSKAGGAFAAATNAVSEIGSGFYKVTLTATESNTVGALAVIATATGADAWRDIHQVI